MTNNRIYSDLSSPTIKLKFVMIYHFDFNIYLVYNPIDKFHLLSNNKSDFFKKGLNVIDIRDTYMQSVGAPEKDVRPG